MNDRMFQVLVVSGMALVGCGGTGATALGDLADATADAEARRVASPTVVPLVPRAQDAGPASETYADATAGTPIGYPIEGPQ